MTTLIILAGRPGSGKTTIARALAAQIPAVHIRIDTIEQALRDAGFQGEMNYAGYRVGYAVAEDNLGLGRMVIADSVNPLRISREAWRDVARRVDAPFLDIECICSDGALHRRRVETRVADIRGLKLPTWDQVVAREYDAWDEERIVIDTSLETVAAAVARIAPMIDQRDVRS